MGWREILKPTLWKVLLTFGLLPIQYLILAGGLSWYLNPMLWVFMSLSLILNLVPQSVGMILLWPYLIIGSVLITYLLACIIWSSFIVIFNQNNQIQNIQEINAKKSAQKKRWIKSLLITILLEGIYILFRLFVYEVKDYKNFIWNEIYILSFYSIPILIIVYFIIYWIEKIKINQEVK
jgi:hypothetical protein